MNAPRDLFITGVVMMLCLVGGEAAISAPRTNSSRAPAGQQVGPGAMPKFDVDTTCRAAVDVPTATPATCLADERSAQDELAKGWAQYPSPERARCTALSGIGYQSYVELLTWLEMAAQAKKAPSSESDGSNAR
jgi:hypothetical protein